MELYRTDKTLNKKFKIDILGDIHDEIFYRHENDTDLKLKEELINFSLHNFNEYDLYIDLIKLWKKAENMDELMNLLKNKVKISHKTRYIKGGETMIKHDFIEIGRNKYIAGEIVC